jgi:spermidine synthase
MRAITQEVVSDATCSQSGQSRLLLVGLGGGALTMYLRSHCPALQIDAVEANQHVVDAAYHLFGLDSSGTKVSVEVADGGAAIQSRVASGAAYDFIVVDCFQAQGSVPESCRSEAFISGLHSILKPGGKVLQQVWKAQYKSMLRMYHNEFGTARSFGEAVDGMGVNCMIVAAGQDAMVQRHQVKEASAGDSLNVTAYFKATGMPLEPTEISQNVTLAEASIAGKWDTIKQEVKQSKDDQAQNDYEHSDNAEEAAQEMEEKEEEESGEVPRWDALHKGNEWNSILKAPIDMNAHVDIKDFENRS